MGFFILVFLTLIGGGFGGMASAIAQKHKGNTRHYSLLKHAFFYPEKIITGAAASICMFFFLAPLFNLEPTSIKLEDNRSTNIILNTDIKVGSMKDIVASITVITLNVIDEIMLPLRKEPIVYTKILSFSVAAGFAGVPLMETVSKQLQCRLSKDDLAILSKQLQSQLSKDDLVILSKQLQSQLSKDDLAILSKQLQSQLSKDDDLQKFQSSTATIKTINNQAVAVVRKKVPSAKT
ncbi:MAG: hypothetical protein AB4372_02140 [Xenococcus sp. (in: cyanobacteria)]